MKKEDGCNHIFKLPFILGGILFLGLSLIPLFGCVDGPETKNEKNVDITAILFSDKDGETIARAGEKTILTVEELRARINQQAPFMRPRFATEEGQSELVNQMVHFELLAREAARQGLHKDPDVQEAMKRAMVNKLITTRLDTPEKLTEVSDERIREYYEENISDYVQPERIRVSHLFYKADPDSPESISKAEQKAEHAVREIGKSDDITAFNRMVTESSDDPDTRTIGGDLRYKSREELTEEWGASMAEGAFKLQKTGSFSGVIRGDKGFHVLRMTGRQPAVERKIEDVRPLIVNQVQRQDRNKKFEDFLEQLSEKDDLHINEKVLERLLINVIDDKPHDAKTPQHRHSHQRGGCPHDH